MVSWVSVLRTNFKDVGLLADFLQLSLEDRDYLLKKSPFVLNLPYRLAEKIEKGTLDDPILRQFVPLVDEEKLSLGFTLDPVGDEEARVGGKLLHKYEGRALILATSACAMHCRYCFRRHFPYDVDQKGFEDSLQTIREDDSLDEVILSGGDPLSLSDRVLEDLLQKLEKISHLTRIRFHTRFPIGIPERIDENFVRLLKNSSKQLWFVMHVNHPRELDQEVLFSLRRLRSFGPVLCQTVLLKGINDSFKVLYDLYKTLIDQGILPYYLHQLDRVQGGLHFEVEESLGLKLIEELRAHLPGYAIPQYVREIAGQPSKTPILTSGRQERGQLG